MALAFEKGGGGRRLGNTRRILYSTHVGTVAIWMISFPFLNMSQCHIHLAHDLECVLVHDTVPGHVTQSEG